MAEFSGVVNFIKEGEYKNKEGETVQTLEWLLSVPQKREVDGSKFLTVKVTHFGKSAENHLKYVKKGDVVTVSGDIGLNLWNDKTTSEAKGTIVLYPDTVNYFPKGKGKTAETVEAVEDEEEAIVV